MKVVKVTWVDAETVGDSSWQELEEVMQTAKDQPPVMQTVGFVLCECETHISITDSIGEQECGHVTKIPLAMIQEVEVLTTT